MLLSIKKAALFSLTFLAAWLALDVYLQVAEIQTPMETRIDPELGPTYIPNKKITRFNEGFFMGSVNAFGYMGPAVPPRRQGKERRILLLGDSYVLGHTVLPRQYFGRYLEQELGRSTGAVVYALNFGKADFNFGNMYQYYRDFAGRFDHDLALFFISEDDLAPSGQVISKLYPAVTLKGGHILIDKEFRSSRTYRFYHAIEPVFTRSAVLRLVFNAYKVVRSGNWAYTVMDKLAILIPPEAGASAPRGPSEPSQLPDLSRAILRELAGDPRNCLVIQTAISPPLLDDIRSCGMPIIDLNGYLESLRAQGKDPTYWPVTGMRGHWNHAAQPLIGRFLAREILSRETFHPD